jgi:hypothetical protein
VNSNETHALEEIRGYASANRVRFTSHAWLRMDERNVTERDVLYALRTATICMLQANEKWKVLSKDQDDDDLTVIVAFEDEMIVVTLF